MRATAMIEKNGVTTMNSKSLMKMMIETPNYVREKILSDIEIEVFDQVKGTGDLGMTSNVLSGLRDVSVQNASNVLRKLHDKGYLKRTNEGASSGGDEYVYRVAI
jgi:predicted transcriptional regulator